MKKGIIKSIILIIAIICISIYMTACSSNSAAASVSDKSVAKSETTQNSTESSSGATTTENSADSDQTTKSSAAAAGSQEKEKYLTIADVEKVSGEKGIKLVAYNPGKGAGGDLNFAKSDDTMFLLAQIQPKYFWNIWKGQADSFNEPVSGVGDEAFNGPKGMPSNYVLFFLKGDTAFSVSSFFNAGDTSKPFFSEDQLIELAKIMLSR